LFDSRAIGILRDLIRAQWQAIRSRSISSLAAVLFRSALQQQQQPASKQAAARRLAMHAHLHMQPHADSHGDADHTRTAQTRRQAANACIRLVTALAVALLSLAT
jgi:hypothetical protein